MATDSGTWTPSTLPTQYQNPSLQLAATATNTSTVISVSTGSTAHNLVVGQPVILYGFSSAWLNYAPNSTINGVSTALGAGKPAIVASVTSSTVFTVNGSFSTTASAIAGYVQNDTLVTAGPLSGGDFWLTPTSVTNQAVGLEWGDSLPIQPNTGRTNSIGATTATTASISGVTANGSTIVYTVASDPTTLISAGSLITIDGVVPSQFNFNQVSVASVTSTQITVLSTSTGTYDSVNSFGQIAAINTAGGSAQAVATSAVGPIQVPNVSATSSSTLLYYTSGANHGLITGQYVTISGMVPTGLNVSGAITKVDNTNFTITSAANPGTSTKSGWASVQSNSYTTQQAHGLTTGQNVSVTGASLAEYNVSGLVVATASTKIASVNAAKFPVNPASTTPVTVSGTAVTFTLASGHNATTSDSVSVYGFIGGANLNTRGDVAVSATTANSITINTPAQVALSSATVAVASNLLTITKASSFGSIKAGQLVTIAGVSGVANTAAFNTNFVVVSATAGALVAAMPTAVSTASISVASATLTVSATTAATPVSGVTDSSIATTANSITLTLPNNFVVGQPVTVAGTGTNYDASGTVATASPSAVTITYPSTFVASGTPAVSTSAAPITVSTLALPVASSTTSADSSKFGYLVKKGGTFVSPAYVGGTDGSWGSSYTVPSITLNSVTDNAEIVTTPRLGYPDYFPKYVVPNVVGKTYTNAIQALKAAGLDGTVINQTTPTGITGTTAAATTAVTVSATTNVKIGMPVSGLGIASGTTVAAIPDSTHITLSTSATSTNSATALSFGVAPNTLTISAFATTTSTVTYTVSSVASLSVGDYVNILYVKDDTNTGFLPNTQYNRNQVAISSIDTANSKITVNVAGVTGANPTGGVVVPLNSVVTVQNPSAATVLTEGTDSKLVTLTRNTGL
jgi:hypothetical protein